MEISEFKCMTCSTAITKGEYATFGVCDACYDANYKRQTASGSVAAPKEERTCPKCGSGKIIMFNSDDDLCQTCGATFPGVLNGCLELASLRQQLKEREEALKELLSLAVRYKNTVNFTTREDEFDRTQAIIEKARNLLSK